nr:helix-turn-helix transcriptional regulator [uncultured Cohaesibacter sp.]
MSGFRKLNEEEVFTYSFTSTQQAVNMLRSVYRKAAKDGLTQAELARITGKNKAHINRILRGKIDGIHVGTVEVLLRAMGSRLDLNAVNLSDFQCPKQSNWRPESGLSDIVLNTVSWDGQIVAKTSGSGFLSVTE